MKELIFISACPDDLVFSWQYEVFIENLRETGYTEEIRILLFLPHDRLKTGWNPRWEMLEERYKDQNVKFYRYEDKDNILAIIRSIDYIPLLRPYVLAKHFEEFPELKEKAIFYHDSDIVFTKYLDFSPFLSNYICYLSDTKSYINSDYFDSKIKDVLPDSLESYKLIDVLDDASHLCGITRKICEDNKDASGGAQYLLKNMDSEFWQDVFVACINIRNYLYYNKGGINSLYFANENLGFQSWCADMWGVLWNLWKREYKTITPKELDFAWATDSTKRWKEVYIYHDAGVGGGNESYLFNKRDHKYINNITTPFQHEITHVSKDYSSSLYLNEILKVKDKYYT